MTTYYVATNGSDGGTGAIGDPWRTIQRGVNALGGGDTLLIRGGTYNEAVSVPAAASGTSGAHTTIKAYTGETVVIDGEYAIPAGAIASPLRKAIEAGTVVPVAGSPNYRFVQTGATVYPATVSPLVDIGAHWVDFEDIKITRSLGRGLRIFSSTGHHDNVTVSNCEISYSRWHTVTAYGDSDVLDGCDIHHSNMFAPFSRSASTGAGGMNWGSGIGQAESTNLTVQNCKIHEHWGEGIILVYGTTVQDCEVYRCYSAHIYVESADACTVRGNLIWHDGIGFLRNGGTIMGINLTNEYNGSPGTGSGNGARVYNNIVVGCGKSLAIFKGEGYYEDIRVFNNTFVNPYSPNGEKVLISIGGARMNDVFFYNNIFYTSDGATAANTSIVDAGSDGAEFYNNCWYGVASLAASLKGTGDIYANPLIKNPNAPWEGGPVAANYQILEDSPCINASTATPQAPTDDYFGNARSSADIGAHEYGGTISDYLFPAFSGAPLSGEAPLSVALTDSSTASETITARYWYYRLSGDTTWSLFDSGNNTSVTLQVNSAGSYDVRLRCVTATQDASEIKAAYIVATTPGVEPGDPGDTGSSGASGVIGVGTAYANTTVGEQTITLNNSGITPTIAMVVVSAATAAGSGDGAILSVGLTDGTRTRSSGVTVDDAVATSVAGRSNRDDNIIVINDGTTKRDAYASFVAFGAGYITINWIVPPPDGYVIQVWAAQADDAYVGDEAVASSMSVTAPNFQSSGIIWISGFGAYPSSGANGILAMGITTADTSGAAGIYWENGAAAGDNNGYVFDGAVGIANASGSRAWEFTPAITATGWDGTLTGSAFGSIIYGCFRFASNDVWCDVLDTPTSTGAAANTTPAFPAGAGLAIVSNMAAAGSGVTDGTAGSLSVGMWAGTGQFAAGITNEHGADPTQAASHKSDNRFVHAKDDDGATTALQAYIETNAAGYDLTWETVQGTARKIIVLVVEGTAPATGGAATSAVVTYGSAYANTSTGNQTITLNDAITPTFAIVKMTGVTSGSNPAAPAILSLGMTDGTNVRCVGVAAENNVATSNAGRVSRADNLIAENNFTTGRTSYASFVSFSEGSITINWDVAPASAYLIEVLAFAADDAYVGDKVIASSMTETGPNFESGIIFWLAGNGAFPSSGNDAVVAFGVTTADTTGMIGVGWDDAAADGANSGYMIDGKAVLSNATGGRVWDFTPAITATGWSTSDTAGTLTGSVAFGCIRLASNAVWADVIDTPTSTGAAAGSAPGFPAGAGLAIISVLTASASAATDGTAGTFGIGLWAGDSQAAGGITNEDAADPTATASNADSDSFVKLLADDGSTVYLDAAISQAETGFSLDWATVQASACKMVVVVIEGEQAPTVPYYDWYMAGMNIGAMVGFP